MRIITIHVEDADQPKLMKAIVESAVPLAEFTITTPKPPRVRAKKGEQSAAPGTPSPKS